MIALVENNLKLIHDVCKKHHVKSLYLIGSAARQEKAFSSESDVDLLYQFDKNAIKEMDYADNYFDLLFALQDIFNRKVDLIAEEKLRNPYFISSINNDRQKLYEA